MFLPLGDVHGRVPVIEVTVGIESEVSVTLIVIHATSEER
jgi:hypothetical protein